MFFSYIKRERDNISSRLLLLVLLLTPISNAFPIPTFIPVSRFIDCAGFCRPEVIPSGIKVAKSAATGNSVTSGAASEAIARATSASLLEIEALYERFDGASRGATEPSGGATGTHQ
ncbi:hypothetical protein M433DRAFT_156939 [Acidomyces richmondensis BFW]|nr:MAG: hypothetical protein FE78DRAFT_92811 [Acidomyces sp. 'richmondensis']KYG43298.1 hypothetical protein M433DRAFT_156939 [Acidomyces richmondensis BFW]